VIEGGLAGRAVRASRSNLIAFPVIAIFAFAAGIVVARTLPIGEFAVYALALALRGTVQFLADLGAGTASARAFAQLEAANRRAYSLRLYGRLAALRLAVVALLAGATFAAADAALSYLGLATTDRAALAWLVIMGAAEVIGGLGTYALTGTLRQRWLNGVLIAYSVLQPGLVVTAAVAGLGLSGVLAALAVASIAKCVALQLGAVRALRRMGAHGESDEGLGRSLIQTAGAAGVGKIAAWVHSRPALSFLMLPGAGRADFAVFALGYDLAHQIMAVVAAPMANVIPAVAAKTTHDRARLRRIAGTVVVLSLTTSAGVALVAYMALAQLDAFFYGSAYKDIGVYLLVLLPALVLDVGVATPATAILLADDRLLGRFTRVRAVELSAAVLYLVVGFQNLLAVTAVMATVRASTAIALLWVVQRQLGSVLPNGWTKRFGCAAGVAAAAGAAGGAVPGPDGVTAAVGAALAACAFILMVRRLGILGDAELDLTARVLPPARRVTEWLERGRADSPRRVLSTTRSERIP